MPTEPTATSNTQLLSEYELRDNPVYYKEITKVVVFSYPKAKPLALRQQVYVPREWERVFSEESVTNVLKNAQPMYEKGTAKVSYKYSVPINPDSSYSPAELDSQHLYHVFEAIGANIALPCWGNPRGNLFCIKAEYWNGTDGDIKNPRAWMKFEGTQNNWSVSLEEANRGNWKHGIEKKTLGYLKFNGHTVAYIRAKDLGFALDSAKQKQNKILSHDHGYSMLASYKSSNDYINRPVWYKNQPALLTYKGKYDDWNGDPVVRITPDYRLIDAFYPSDQRLVLEAYTKKYATFFHVSPEDIDPEGHNISIFSDHISWFRDATPLDTDWCNFMVKLKNFYGTPESLISREWGFEYAIFSNDEEGEEVLTFDCPEASFADPNRFLVSFYWKYWKDLFTLNKETNKLEYTGSPKKFSGVLFTKAFVQSYPEYVEPIRSLVYGREFVPAEETVTLPTPKSLVDATNLKLETISVEPISTEVKLLGGE